MVGESAVPVGRSANVHGAGVDGCGENCRILWLNVPALEPEEKSARSGTWWERSAGAAVVHYWRSRLGLRCV